jgi:two-component system, sensor histidine kinase and response regulator
LRYAWGEKEGFCGKQGIFLMKKTIESSDLQIMATARLPRDGDVYLPRPLFGGWLHGVYRRLPRRLSRQIMLLTAACLMVSILGYGAYTAQKQTDLLRSTITTYMAALAQNVATVDAQFLLVDDLVSIELVSMQTATTPSVLLVEVMDASGKLLSEVAYENGRSIPKFSHEIRQVPKTPQALTQVEKPVVKAIQAEVRSAWHPIVAGSVVGWVRVSYQLERLNQAAIAIWTQALLVMVLAMLMMLGLLGLLLRPPMRALQLATQFATDLDHALGAKIDVSSEATEIQALGEALNQVSARLFAQNRALNNQKFALDQHAIVSITDLNGTICYANDFFCEITGYLQSELIGKNHRIINSGFHSAVFFEVLWDTISNGKVWHGAIRNRSKNGKYYWVDSTIVPLLGADGMPEQYIAIRTDITDMKNFEHSLQEAKTNAEGASIAKGQFLANMSHEIRTPMNAILGMLKLLKNTELSPRQLDYTHKTEGAAQSLLGLLNDILDFSKMDAGKMALNPEPFYLDRLLRDLSVILSANVGSKQLEVLFDIDPATPQVMIGDMLRLRQVLINLAGNAIKFTASGEVVVQIKVLSRVGAETTLSILVRDSGIGISPENSQHIFDGFSQAEASTTRRFGGTGLGLSICKRLVEMMGGQLSLDSELGQGSSFYFTLAMVATDELPNEVDQVCPRPQSLENLQVLLVDDHATAREIMVDMGRSLGWQMDEVSSGLEALARVEEQLNDRAKTPYQLILMDWKMPDMDGWETSLRIRQISAISKDLIIVMVTTHGRELLAQRSSEEQAALNGFLVKPVTASMLFDAVADAQASLLNLRVGPAVASVKPQRLAGLHVLVVEDNLLNQQVAQELLNAEGALVELAANGQLGIDAIAKTPRPFDVVLMDLQMPIMDGYTATHIIRHGMGLRNLPIIAMTANAMATDREACLAAGMNDHIGKPFDLAHLVRILQSQVRHAHRQVAASLVEASKSVIEEVLPEEDDVDTLGALERLGNNTALYTRVLQSYLVEISSIPDQLDVLLQAGKHEDACRLMHTLKGLSATVGASYLAAVAKSAESTLKQAVRSVEGDDLAAQIRAAVLSTSHIMSQIAQMAVLPVIAVTEPALDTQQLLADIQELHGLLRGSDMLAFDVHARLQKTHARSAANELKALYDAMGEFDFSRGLQQCETLLQKYGALN